MATMRLIKKAVGGKIRLILAVPNQQSNDIVFFEATDLLTQNPNAILSELEKSEQEADNQLPNFETLLKNGRTSGCRRTARRRSCPFRSFQIQLLGMRGSCICHSSLE